MSSLLLLPCLAEGAAEGSSAAVSLLETFEMWENATMLVVTAQMLSLAFPGFWKGKQWLLKWCNWKILLSLAGWEKHGSFWWFFSRRRGKVWQHHWGTGGRPVIHIWLEKENNHLSRKGCKHHVFTFCLGTFCRGSLVCWAILLLC